MLKTKVTKVPVHAMGRLTLGFVWDSRRIGVSLSEVSLLKSIAFLCRHSSTETTREDRASPVTIATIVNPKREIRFGVLHVEWVCALQMECPWKVLNLYEYCARILVFFSNP